MKILSGGHYKAAVPAPPAMLDAALAQRLKAAIDGRTIQRLGPVGSTERDKSKEGEGWNDLPKTGSLLVGFEYANGRWKDAPMVKALRPIFLTPTGIVSGKARGIPYKDYKTIKAKEGFAVSGLIVNPGKERLGGFQVIFAKIDSGKAETYKSEWIGGEITDGAVTLGGDGKLGVGVFGITGADVASIGLIVAP